MHEDSEDEEKSMKHYFMSLWELCYRFIKKEEAFKETA